MSNSHFQNSDAPPSRYALGAVLLLFGALYMNFISRVIFSPLLIHIERDLGVSHATTGSFFLMIAAGYAVAMVNSGFVSYRLTHRGTILLSLGGIASALLLLSFAHALWLFRLGLFMLGLATGLYAPSGVASLTQMVNVRHWGKALATHDVGPNLAFVTAPLLVTLVLTFSGWRTNLLILAVLCVLMSAIFAIFSNAGRFSGQRPHLGNIRLIASNPSFWAVTAFFVMAIGSTVGVFSILPTYLIAERNLPEQQVNTIVAFSRVSSVVFVLFSGFLKDRFGERILIGTVIATTAVLTIGIGLARDWLLLTVVFLQPAVIAAFFPAALSALASSGPPESRNVAVSLVVPGAYVLGGGVFPTVMGILGEYDRFAVGFLGAGVLMLAVLPLLKWIPRHAAESAKS